jgi:hypothetical protein
MHLLKSYEQTAVFDPTNPNQKIREAYVGGIGYGSYYFNPVDTGAQLRGLRGLNGWDQLPSWLQMAIVGAGAVAVGYYSMAKWGDSHIKPVAKKIPIVGSVLSGPRTRRRR